MNVSLEMIMAAFIEQEGEIFIGDEFFMKDYDGKAIAIEPDPLRSGWKFTLVNEKDVEYLDEDE